MLLSQFKNKSKDAFLSQKYILTGQQTNKLITYLESCTLMLTTIHYSLTTE